MVVYLNIISAEKATDSGFVGSESSRQSSKKRDSIQPEPVSAVSKNSAASERFDLNNENVKSIQEFYLNVLLITLN